MLNNNKTQAGMNHVRKIAVKCVHSSTQQRQKI